LPRRFVTGAPMGALMNEMVAIVDNDRESLNSITTALLAEGFNVQPFVDGAEALQRLAAQPADLAILENKMPGLGGVELLSRLRKDSAIPIMFLTSNTDEVDELIGLRMGADAYLMKPVPMRLLIERIRALIRRAARATINSTNDESVIRRGNLQLDPTRHRCTWRGTDINLTATEFHLLKVLALRPGHVKSRDQLMEVINSNHVYALGRSIDSHMKRLRVKLKMADPNFTQIETLYGIGYRFVDARELVKAD
jgi:two-component system, OmpR family, response regulator ChvI